ncbi:short-chain dehydrogenase [Actibacterium mucosum KCTC 23349]|uniref:Short-chain dehydrogenase n=1 Tax=Actibacterium mucosum KCTC 23349 TaxID=1454373 RepID=A0A037ZM98_9RHOB|nr:bifunctional aldolase/short-chain dehydrogenase [Actibacterium mucosum]KAJ55896.1 short-chain dehydrogenase [Actibacterium mucosum KCTC 23349]
MIENWYDAAKAAEWRSNAGDDPADQELGERVYTSRLIGQNPDLLMHGGGNTSVKLERPDIFGNMQRVLHVKGSGWDLDVIEAPGLPGVWLDPLLKLRALDAMSDEDMVNYQRSSLLNSASPNPSVETLLHAFLPHKYVDHTHATPFLVLANLPNAADICREIFGDRLGIVPYIMPGFGLAKKAAEVYEQNPDVEGLLLIQHGHFAFGGTAKESYDTIVRHSNEVAAYFGLNSLTPIGERVPAAGLDALPVLRGVIAEVTADRDGAMPVFDLRNGPATHEFMLRDDIEALAKRGMASPDHVLRTKGQPLILRKADLVSRDAIKAKVEAFANDYRAYFDRQAPNANEPKKLLTPDPKHAWIEGIGLVGMGGNAKAASAAADLAEQNIRVRAVGEDAGGFYPLNEKDQFDCEYWSLEQAKMGKGTPPPFQGKVVMVTGGAGAIGLATAKAFAAKGANILLVDMDQGALDKSLESLGKWHATHAADITVSGAAEAAVQAAIAAFGGLDILVSNAGSATGGAMLDLDDAAFRKAFELNFFAHKNFATTAAKLMQTQGRGGQILFNISKQAINPGKNMGAYGTPKAATLFLMRQLTLELAGSGIRVNGMNADRIRSGLLTDDFIKERAAARGVSEETYMGGNLLGREVEARHVADGFVNLALMERTTGHVVTVDGGNTEAELR